MVKEIITEKRILEQKCISCSGGEGDKIVKDLIDTAEEHKENCAGLAANQLGYVKRVIVVRFNDKFISMVNPKILKMGGGTQWLGETCLSRPGEDAVFKTRFKKVKVEYEGRNGMENRAFRNLEARVLQHEMDHLEGVLI